MHIEIETDNSDFLKFNLHFDISGFVCCFIFYAVYFKNWNVYRRCGDVTNFVIDPGTWARHGFQYKTY